MSAPGVMGGWTREAGCACSSASLLDCAAWPRAAARAVAGSSRVVSSKALLIACSGSTQPSSSSSDPGLVAAECAADAAQGVGELARDDPHLVRVALGDLRQHLEVLVGEQLLVGVAAVDRVEDLQDRPGLALGLEDARLRRALGAQDLALLLALGGEDLADCLVPSAVRIMARRSRSAFICFSIESWTDGRRVDRLELDAVDPDAPLAGVLVEHAAQLAVDLVAAGEGLLEVERADDVAQGGDGQLLDARR